MKTYIVVSYILVIIAFVGCLIGEIVFGGQSIPPSWATIALIAILVNSVIALVVAILDIIFGKN